MSAPPVLSPPGRPSTAATLEQVHELAGWLADPQRTRPALVVTTRNLQQHPYFPMGWAQELVGSDADVVAIAQSPGGDLTKKLERRLPEGWMSSTVRLASSGRSPPLASIRALTRS